MRNIKVNYLGLELSSPIIASSSGLTSNVESIKEIEKAGAGAVVLKSLFEEQILGEVAHNEQYSDYPGAAEYLNAYIKENSVNNYLSLIKSVKRECSIPVIASVCCVIGGEWNSFAKEMEGAGADALELNVFFLPTGSEQSGAEIEASYLNTVEEVVKAVSIPVSVKISSHFTNPMNIARELYFRGVKGVVMFNRLYDPNINIENLTVTTANIFSSADEIRHSLRWIAMSSARQPQIDYSASTGVHSGEEAVKMLLVGATTVQMCSTLYRKGVGEIEKANSFISDWMDKKGYAKIVDFKAMLNCKNLEQNIAFERSQFMKYYSSYKK